MYKLDFNKINNIKQMALAIYQVQKSSIDFDEKEIENLIKKCLEITQLSLTNDEFDRTKKDLMMQCQVKHSYEGAMILDNYTHSNWYDEVDLGEEFYWNRYKNYLLNTKHFGLNIVNKLEKETLKDLMNSLGNPNSNSSFLRRGLVIGDVQSGKTSTYIGLICKAADAGYKVIILLTGTIESLRKQTQERIEEGFVGANIDKIKDKIDPNFRVGVGKDGQPLRVTAFTSREDDFVGNKDKILTSIESNKVVLFVIKKNTTVLNKLIKWLYDINSSPIDKKIHYPMLLIDDEADNASINTRKEDEDPTAVNRSIRKLVDLFTQSNYVGFTATPFANVFINPNTDEDMINADLFPENFIYCLPTPSNYIGAKQIFCDDGQYRNSLIFIKDAGMVQEDGFDFYCKHKKEWNGNLPKSLNDAIYGFLIVNAIRDLKKDTTTHRSMIINLSRFIRVQLKIKDYVEKVFNEAARELKFNLTDDIVELKKNPILSDIHNVWLKYYSNTGFSWKEICSIINTSISPIIIKVVNSGKNSEKIDYDKYKNEGLRVIAIGGLALSRGLTLEGLIVSYFFRNTSTYDVLMQMGRWFGYRPNYEDLFRIWVGEKSAAWYAEISNATEELKYDVGRMWELKRTPKDFGIRVRNDSNELRITAPNKMRTAADEIIYDSYFGRLIQAPYIINDANINFKNIKLVENLIQNAENLNNELLHIGSKYLFKNLSKDLILTFLHDFKLSNANSRFDIREVYDFLITCNDDVLENWDVAIVEGSSKKEPFPLSGKNTIYKVNLAKRTGFIDEDKISVSSRGQLTGPSDATIGLDNPRLKEAVEKLFKEDYFKLHGEEFTSDKTFPAKIYFEYIEKGRNPLLLIYLLELPNSDTDIGKQTKAAFGDIPLVSLAMGIPRSKYDPSKFSIYKVNRVYQEEGEEE